jgi:hypothetical protein
MVFDFLKFSDEVKQIMRTKFDQVFATGENQRNRDFRLKVLNGEVGDISTALVYEEVFGKNSPELKRAYSKGHVLRAVADAFIQCLLFADNENMSPDELLQMGLGGLDEYLERKRESMSGPR